MARSKQRPHRTRVPATPSRCPCGLPAPYAECCGRLHAGTATAPTAEALMRSRYSAYAVGDRAYLLRTWHPDTRPESLELDPQLLWRGLEIVSTGQGGPFHTRGTVAFRAHYTVRGTGRGAQRPENHTLEEHSRFARHEGAWMYVDAAPPGP